MGTPAFAVPSLAELINSGFNVVGVITAPDRPAGRGQQIQQSDVKKFAAARGLKVLQPEKLKDETFLAELKSLNADLQVVVAFRMLPEVVWNMPRMGTINLHGSLLPQYRGAAPINHAIINGETATGVTTFFLQHQIDTGNIIDSQKITIEPEDNFGTLHDKMMQIGAKVIVKTVHSIQENSYSEYPQDNSLPLIPAPKLTKEFCKIQWNQEVESIHNHVRGLSPYPTAFTTINNKNLKIFKSKFVKENVNSAPGTFKTDGKTYLKFAAIDGYLYVSDIQLEGKKRMTVEELLRGFRPA